MLGFICVYMYLEKNTDTSACNQHAQSSHNNVTNIKWDDLKSDAFYESILCKQEQLSSLTTCNTIFENNNVDDIVGSFVELMKQCTTKCFETKLRMTYNDNDVRKFNNKKNVV